MKVAEAGDELKQFRHTAWKFQATFLTPLKDLRRFVATIASAGRPERASVTIETTVFEPKHLLKLLSSRSIPARNLNNVTLTAANQDEVASLLEAALGDWADFLFIPEPSAFAIYADHDEYTTLYADSHLSLSQVVKPLENAGFKLVADYKRLF